MTFLLLGICALLPVAAPTRIYIPQTPKGAPGTIGSKLSSVRYQVNFNATARPYNDNLDLG